MTDGDYDKGKRGGVRRVDFWKDPKNKNAATWNRRRPMIDLSAASLKTFGNPAQDSARNPAADRKVERGGRVSVCQRKRRYRRESVRCGDSI